MCRIAIFATLFVLMDIFMEMNKKTEEQVTYSITLANLASANIEADGENEFTCSSGGAGLSSCSASSNGGISGASGGTSCSVTCNDGYHSCCNAYHNKCQCKSNS